MANSLLLDPSALTTTKHSSFLSPQSTRLLRPYPIRLTSLTTFSSPFINLKISPKPLKISPNPLKISPKCSAKTPNSSDSEQVIKEKTLSSIGFFLDKISEALNVLKKAAVAALLVGVLLMYDPNSVFAASGGRMGGDSWNSFSQSYSVQPSSSGHSRSVSSNSQSYSVQPSSSGHSCSVSSNSRSYSFGIGDAWSLFFTVMGVIAFIFVFHFLFSDRDDGGLLTATQRISVIKLQVGLLGTARSLQSNLNQIAETADTSTKEGIHYVLTESMLALLRHPYYCISAYSSVDIIERIEEGQKRFNQLSIEERGKFDEETLVNVNNIKRRSNKSSRATGYINEYIVITVLVAAEGVRKLPTINGSMDLKEAIQNLRSIPSSKTMAVEVLWTPQNENDTLSERELLEDYPLLKPL